MDHVQSYAIIAKNSASDRMVTPKSLGFGQLAAGFFAADEVVGLCLDTELPGFGAKRQDLVVDLCAGESSPAFRLLR